MKTQQLGVAGFLVGVALLFAPQGTNALTLPSDIDLVGVSEATYNELKDARCDETRCPELAQQLDGKIILRAEAEGQMYKVKGDVNNTFGKVLYRYLPDGIYKNKKNRLFFVSDGKALRLPKKKAYEQLVWQLQANPQAAIALHNSNGMNYVYNPYCKGYSTQVEFDNCYLFMNSLSGKIVLDLEHNGRLHYLTQGDLPEAIDIQKSTDKGYFKKYMLDYATLAPSGVLRTMPLLSLDFLEESPLQ